MGETTNVAPAFRPRRRRGAVLDRFALRSAIGMLVVLGLIGLTWLFALQSIEDERVDNLSRVQISLDNQAAGLGEQVGRQFLAMEQSLRGLVAAWQADPDGFSLRREMPKQLALSGLSRDANLVGPDWKVRQSTISEAVGRDLAGYDFAAFARGKKPAEGSIYVGGASIDPIMRQWHLNIAAWLHRPDGSLAGAIATEYRVDAILDVFKQAEIGTDGMAALIDTADGRVRAYRGPSALDPNTNVAASAMVRAMKDAPSGRWNGPSATDSANRMHAWRRLPNSSLILVVAMEDVEALKLATRMKWHILRLSGFITLLLLTVGVLNYRAGEHARARMLAQVEDHAVLAATNAQLQVAKAEADAKNEHLEAALEGMADGIYMVDAHFCLVEWNARFPQIAGIPPELLHVGLPMEEILRAQARAGLFGDVEIDVEVAKRMAVLRARQFGTTERELPDGQTIELRRRGLPDGGFVTVYSDITEHKRIEAELRDARSAADTANAEKSRFVAIVSHEIRTPLNALLNTLRLLNDGTLNTQQTSLVGMASKSGEALAGLIDDILEMSRMEAGQLPLRQSDFDLRPLLEATLEIFRPQGSLRDLTYRLDVAEAIPAQLHTDPGRLRQVLLNYLSNATKFANPGEVVLKVETDEAEGPTQHGLRVSVLDRGPVISEEDRGKLFKPFSRLDRPEGDQAMGSGLGLSICQRLVTLMGGSVGCEPWHEDGVEIGNRFWLTLPAKTLVVPVMAAPEPEPEAPSEPSDFDPEMVARKLPRTRILLVEDVAANQVVAATMLRRAGHSVDIASNGEEAIAAVERKPYDIVFMDGYMPVMNGSMATRHIRTLPGLSARVPIVALSASTEEEDAVLFRAAGMDDVLGKPIALPELIKCMGRLVWPAHPIGTDRIASIDRHRDLLPSDVLAMDRINELKTNLPPDVLEKLIEDCLTDLEDRMPLFGRTLRSGSPKDQDEQAHAIAGVAASYGLAALEAKARAIMAAVRDGGVANPVTEFAAIEAELARGAAMIRSVLDKQAAA